jgi:hypothetical protein
LQYDTGVATASVKLAPPRVSPWYVPRPALERRMDEAAAYRLTSVVAAGIAAALDDVTVEDLVVVVEDVHELGRDSGAGVVPEGLVRYAPPGFHLVLCSRDEPPFRVSRLRGRGPGRYRRVRPRLHRGRGVRSRRLSRRVGCRREHGPAAHGVVRLAGCRPARRRRPADDASGRPGSRGRVSRRPSGPLLSYLADEVFGREPAEVQRLLADLAELESALSSSSRRWDTPERPKRSLRWSGAGSCSRRRRDRRPVRAARRSCASSRRPVGARPRLGVAMPIAVPRTGSRRRPTCRGARGVDRRSERRSRCAAPQARPPSARKTGVS